MTSVDVLDIHFIIIQPCNFNRISKMHFKNTMAAMVNNTVYY